MIQSNNGKHVENPCNTGFFLLCPGSQLVVKMWAEIEPFLTTFSTFSDVLSMVADVGTVLAVDMVNRAHTTVCRVSTGAILEIRHNQTRMTGKVLRQLANVSRPLRPRTARSWQRETVTFRYAFHVAGLVAYDVNKKTPCRHPAAREPAAFFNLPWGCLYYSTPGTPASMGCTVANPLKSRLTAYVPRRRVFASRVDTSPSES